MASLEPPIYRSTGDNLDLGLASQGKGVGQWSEPLACGIRHYLQIESISIELRCRTPADVGELLGYVRGKHTYYSWEQNFRDILEKVNSFSKGLEKGQTKSVLGAGDRIRKSCGLRKRRRWKGQLGLAGGWLGGDLVLVLRGSCGRFLL